MPTYPSLSENPCYPIQEVRVDSVIRSPFEGGYVQTRQLFTRQRKTWQINYMYMTTTDKETLDTFIDTVGGGADSFSWTNPQDSVSYTVRFAAPPNFSYASYGRWNVNFTLEQV